MAVLDTEILVNYYFEEICKIPHGSYNEEKIADFVEAFAKEKGFRYHRDHLNNCLLYTSPSPRDRQKSRMPSSAWKKKKETWKKKKKKYKKKKCKKRESM